MTDSLLEVSHVPRTQGVLHPYRFTLLFALILQAIAGLCSLIPLIAISQVAVAPIHQYYEWVIIAVPVV